MSVFMSIFRWPWALIVRKAFADDHDALRGDAPKSIARLGAKVVRKLCENYKAHINQQGPRFSYHGRNEGLIQAE
jgi:hypothetical protein